MHFNFPPKVQAPIITLHNSFETAHIRIVLSSLLQTDKWVILISPSVQTRVPLNGYLRQVQMFLQRTCHIQITKMIVNEDQNTRSAPWPQQYIHCNTPLPEKSYLPPGNMHAISTGFKLYPLCQEMDVCHHQLKLISTLVVHVNWKNRPTPSNSIPHLVFAN